MIETALTITLAILLVISCAGWSWWLWKQSSQILNQAQALRIFKQLNDELDARVQTRVKIVNKQILSGEPGLGQGVMVNAGADSLTTEQPPISMTALLDDAHEVERELKRYKNPEVDYDKRDAFGDYEEA
jgi:cbb3-type cytochrome oxidase subunit 3